MHCLLNKNILDPGSLCNPLQYLPKPLLIPSTCPEKTIILNHTPPSLGPKTPDHRHVESICPSSGRGSTDMGPLFVRGPSRVEETGYSTRYVLFFYPSCWYERCVLVMPVLKKVMKNEHLEEHNCFLQQNTSCSSYGWTVGRIAKCCVIGVALKLFQSFYSAIFHLCPLA